MTEPSPETTQQAPLEEVPNPAAPETVEEAPPLDPVAQLTQEMERWKDMAYRSQAELDNFRKRSAREAQETRAYANGDLLRALFPILDNFDMGLEAARAESEKSMIFMGMSMVNRQLQDFLRDSGVQEVEAMGKTFDPNLHEAVAQEASAEVPEGTIIRVTRRGYKLKDRLLRAASVIVSSGPAAPAEA
ncbi:nucleotide exchange factor GrpE [Prosthecobacter sp.]|uniref:nucleotide exchange factor GrpE n=1 Tax=Prosthecobacter sp. TaxID=1965333 RepID=UPI001D8A2875|nr:nucleotide exchange factor GrpE [Prosthecobacter sp.]MCB1275432.1 nucleotide exchange factor GrpE [Prosthecobacter sp.]